MNCNRNNCGCASRGQHIRINQCTHTSMSQDLAAAVRSSAASAAEDAAATARCRVSHRSIMAACAALSVISNAG